MSKDHEAYWFERSLQDSAKAYNFVEKQLKKLRKEYKKSIATIEKEMLQAKDYEKKRLDELKEKIENEMDRLYKIEELLTKDTLEKIYEDGYYHSIYNYQQALGYGEGVYLIGARAAEIVINRAWSGKNYSERIWTHRKLLGKKVEQIVTQGTILGHSNAKMATKLANEMIVSFNQAARLVRTETNYVHNQATKAGYEAMGQDTYIFLATLDLRTSDVCQSLDGQKFKTKDAKPGVNYPPMHPNCRSTTIPDVEVNKDDIRLAKLNGKYYEVPASMTYEQWYKEIVQKHGADKVASMKKMVINESADRKLHEQYRETLGKHVPKSFTDFQELKYNKNEEWQDIKGLYRYIKVNPESNRAYYEINKDIKKAIADGKISKMIGTAVKPIPVEFDNVNKHALKRMKQRNITETDAKEFISKAKVMFKQQNGAKNMYYSEKGAACVVVEEKVLVTVFSSNDYDEAALKIMEVLKKHGK
ncbi:minor capsid protein [Schinkia azotoformans]|uniref:minor capsid protein n=1 Tax=Schinkia azotoformans TaxID=1454 RepID=UPI002E1BA78E|nr:minor capsid protein [Schinkia azotoformans]MED4377974.1 minor capsid protein [Schinkia azotoformans]